MSEPLTITAAAPLIRTGELTPSELLEQCLRRIDIYEPAVKAWAYLDRERARQDAAKATDEIKAGHYRGPLHGIPIGIKDIIDVFDMPTGCGSKRWANSYARQDATCVERLRQAGAVILGKTVTTAYAYLDPPVTRNPWNLDRTPGGSSSGSAAAVACGMCLAALGTQTGGSTIRPASYCGIYSLKPNHGRISRDGVLPLAPSLDHIGIMARCVRDLAIVFEATGGQDGRDNDCWSDAIPDCQRSVDDGLNEVDQPSLSFMVTRGIFHEKASETMRHAVERVNHLLVMSGENIGYDDARPPAGFESIHAHYSTVIAAEAATVHAARFGRHPDDYPPKIAELIRRGMGLTATEYSRALQHRRQMEQANVKLFGDFTLLTPATPDAAPDSMTTGDPLFNSPWSFLGYPVISLPVDWSTDGLPLAVQLVSSRCYEDQLFRHAAWLERAVGFDGRLPPVPAA